MIVLMANSRAFRRPQRDCEAIVAQLSRPCSTSRFAFSITISATCQYSGDGGQRAAFLGVAGRHRRSAPDAAFNGGAKVFQQAWVAAEEDEAVGQWAMPFREPRAATGRKLQLVALVFPREQPSGRSFAAGREQARPE